MNVPLISVIIPVYNRESTIKYCLESLIQQTFLDFEVIIVDDGSYDKTTEICELYIYNEPRFRLFKQSNSGPSAARNLGLKYAKGKYITFLDSDDAYGRDHLKRLSKIESFNVDLVITGFINVSVSNGIWTEFQSFENEKPLICRTSEDVIKYLFQDNYAYEIAFYLVWNKIWRKDIIDNYNISFPLNVTLGEDQMFVCEYLKHTHSLVVYNSPTYYNLDILGTLPGLGSSKRTPEDFFINIVNSYNSIYSLYQRLHFQSIYQYSEDYLIDRIVSRVGIRCIEQNTIGSLFEYIEFIQKKVVPLISQHSTSLKYVVNPTSRKLANLLCKKKVVTFVIYAYYLKLFKRLKAYPRRILFHK